jgi:hypothetical protein
MTFIAWPSDDGRWIKLDPATAPDVLREFEATTRPRSGSGRWSV